MTYDYCCHKCEKQWEENLPIVHREKPCNLPCPHCGEKGSVEKIISSSFISYEGAVSPIRRAGSGWNDVLKRIHSNAGRQSKIETY